jgi:anti-sigma B factor antagonist
MRGNGSFGPGGESPQDVGAGGLARDHVAGEERFAVSRRALEDGTALVEVAGELDLASAPRLKRTLADAVAAGASGVVLDFSRVAFIDSTALGVLVGVNRTLPAQARMAIAAAGPDVRNVFELTGLDATFDMFTGLEEALDFVRGSEAAIG